MINIKTDIWESEEDEAKGKEDKMELHEFRKEIDALINKAEAELGFALNENKNIPNGEYIKNEDILQEKRELYDRAFDAGMKSAKGEMLKKSEWQIEIMEIQQHLIDTRKWLIQLRSEFNDHVNKGGVG